MQINIKKLSSSLIEIDGEISIDDFNIQKERAVKELGENLKIDGFRFGKIPENILVKKIGEEVILEKTAWLAIQKVYPEIIKKYKIEVIGQPKITITKIAKDNPLGFKIKATVFPEIEIQNWQPIVKDIMTKSSEVEIKDEEVNMAINNLRKMHTTKNEKGEEILSELNDDFVKSLNNHIAPNNKLNNVEELKVVVRKNLEFEKKSKIRDEKRMQVIEKIISDSKIEAPEVLIEVEKEKMLNDMKMNIAQTGIKWEDYFKSINKSEDDLMRDIRIGAEKRVDIGLVLRQLAINEKVEVLNDEIEKEAKKLIFYHKQAGQKVDEKQIRIYIFGILRNKKVFELMEKAAV